MATVLIIGASRGIGREAVKRALSAGHRVRALARSRTDAGLNGSKLERVTADALDQDAVRRALDGVDAIIQALGVRAGPRMVLRPVHLFSDGTRVLVDAMNDAGVKRLIAVTGFGAGNSRAIGSLLYCAAFELFLGRAYNDKDYQERIIRNSDLDWVIVRPGILTNGPKTKTYRVLDRPDEWRNGYISRADVADFLVQQIDDDTYLRKTPVLIG